MKTQEIQSLVDRYLAAESTPEEERRLALALHEAAAATGDDLPADWQAALLMLGELTLGEALYDDILARRNPAPLAQSPSAQSVRLATESQKSRRLRLWRWAAAVALVLATGLGVALHQSRTPQPMVASVSLTGETSESHQWDKRVSPVRQDSATIRISDVDPSHEQTRMVASTRANRRKRRTVRPETMLPPTEMPSSPQEERAEEPLLATAEAGQQPENVQYQSLTYTDDPYAALEAEMRDIRSRGERVEAMIAKLTGPIE